MTGQASAQMPMPSISLGKDKPAMTPEERARQQAIDKAYRKGLGKIPAKNRRQRSMGRCSRNTAYAVQDALTAFRRASSR